MCARVCGVCTRVYRHVCGVVWVGVWCAYGRCGCMHVCACGHVVVGVCTYMCGCGVHMRVCAYVYVGVSSLLLLWF